jgi:hypothetical protein
MMMKVDLSHELPSMRTLVHVIMALATNLHGRDYKRASGFDTIVDASRTRSHRLRKSVTTIADTEVVWIKADHAAAEAGSWRTLAEFRADLGLVFLEIGELFFVGAALAHDCS